MLLDLGLGRPWFRCNTIQKNAPLASSTENKTSRPQTNLLLGTGLPLGFFPLIWLLPSLVLKMLNKISAMETQLKQK